MRPISIDSESLCDHFWFLLHFDPARSHYPLCWCLSPARGARGYENSPWFEIIWLRPVDFGVCACPTGGDLGAGGINSEKDAILCKISCRISWRPCFLDLRNICWDIWQKSPNLPILVAKSVFLWNSYSRQTLPIWKERSPLKRLQEDILFVSELLLDPELLSVLFQIFSKNIENFFVHCLELLSVKQFTEISWWVLSSSEWRFHRLRNFGGAQTFSVFFLRVFAKNLLKIDKFDEFLVGIDLGRGQIFIGIIHTDHTVSVNPCGIDPDYWGPHWYRFWTPLRKNVRNLYIRYIEGGGGQTPVWNSVGSPFWPVE